LSKLGRRPVAKALREADRLETTGDISGAIEALSRAVEIAPNDPKPFALRGRLLYHCGRWLEAIRDFDRALGLKPDAATTLYFRGRARSMVDELDGAIEDFERCAGLQPEAADVFCELGHIHFFRGNWKQANKAFRTAVRLEPSLRTELEEQLVELEARLKNEG
jgi:tetratricopeptide (TPR) repeat protein